MKKFVSAALAASMVLSLAACGSTATASSTASTSEAASGTPIKIGSIGPITGGAAVYGNAVKNAEELAVKEINAANGLSLIHI